MLHSDLKEHFGKAFMGKSSFDKATRKKIMEIGQIEILGLNIWPFGAGSRDFLLLMKCIST